MIFDVRGPQPTGPLADRLLAGREPPGSAPEGTSVILIDGQRAGPEVVREAVAGGIDRPLLLLHARNSVKDALALPIGLGGESDAFLVLPGPAGESPRAANFSRGRRGDLELLDASSGELGPRIVQGGEVPPPEPPPPVVNPEGFAEEHPGLNAVAVGVMREIAAFQRGTPFPRPRALPDPPKDVIFHRYPPVSESLFADMADPHYGAKYAPRQYGQMTVTYYACGFANVDSYGELQSYVLVVEMATGTKPSINGDLLTHREGLDRSLYLGWFQDRVFSGLNYEIDDGIVLLGTSPNTINKVGTQETKKGFSIDIGFAAGTDGPTPKLGLNFADEVSTTTSYNDWLVGEQSGLVGRDFPPGGGFAPEGGSLQESVRWKYTAAVPFNGVFSGDILAQGPATSAFTPQTLSGFEFPSAAALEIPAGSPPFVKKQVTFNRVLGWSLRYYFKGRVPRAREEINRFWSIPTPPAKMTVDLSPIKRP